jgi:hypothetical protein
MAVVGQMMKPGERIYQLADLSSVWVLAQIYEQDLPFVRAGQSATVRVTYGPERMIEARVETLLPQVEEQTRTATARIALANPDGSLRPGMFVDVRFVARLADAAVLVPDLAVLRSGERNTVFIVHDDGTFDPREIKLGVRSQGNFYEVLSGLAAGERVVVSGQFMLDSESQLRDAIQKMLKSSQADNQPAAAAAADTGRKHGIVGMEDSLALPESANVRLQELAAITVEAAEALAADDLAHYQKTLPAMRHSLAAYLESYEQATQGPLGKFRDALPDRSDLKTLWPISFARITCTTRPAGTSSNARWPRASAPVVGCSAPENSRTPSMVPPCPIVARKLRLHPVRPRPQPIKHPSGNLQVRPAPGKPPTVLNASIACSHGSSIFP